MLEMRKRKHNDVKVMIETAAQEVTAMQVETYADAIDKAQAVKDISEAYKNAESESVDRKFVLEKVITFVTIAGIAAWEERHVISKAFGAALRGRV